LSTAPDYLTALGRNALAWARAYVALKDALVRQGVLEEEAREEARSAANMAAMYDGEPIEGEPCPLCGRI
jgi:siroheme synthase